MSTKHDVVYTVFVFKLHTKSIREGKKAINNKKENEMPTTCRTWKVTQCTLCEWEDSPDVTKLINLHAKTHSDLNLILF